MNAKITVFVICVKANRCLLLHNLHDCNFEYQRSFKVTQQVTGRGEQYKLVFQIYDKYFHYKTFSCDSYCNLIWNICIQNISIFFCRLFPDSSFFGHALQQLQCFSFRNCGIIEKMYDNLHTIKHRNITTLGITTVISLLYWAR